MDSSKGQSWKAYFRGVLGFSVMSLLVLYLLQRVQSWLPFSLGFDNVPAPLAFNTAASFVTNTNWQSYSPDQTLGYSVQIAGLCVQNFVSAAVGIAVSIALVRGFMLRRSDTIGNFWVDLIRGTFRILMPLTIVMGTILIALGVAQNFSGFTTVATVLAANRPSWRPGGLPGGHQGTGHQRRRFLQRQFVPSVREPEHVDQPH